MKKKKTVRKDELFESTRFCTECGEELDDFSLDKSAGDGRTAKARHENCKRTGKFKGDLCSRVFIADVKEDDIPPEDELSNAPEDGVY